VSPLTPEIMSAWLRLQPAAAASGLHTRVSAALWDVHVPEDSVWEAVTQRNSASHFLWFVVEPFRLYYEVDGRPVWSGPLEPNTAHVVQAGQSVRALWQDSGRVLHLYLPHEQLVQVANEYGKPDVELVDRGLQVDPRLQTIVSLLLDRISESDTLGRLEMDTLGILTCAHLLRAWSRTRTASELRGRLGSLQTRRAIAFLNDHLHCDIGLKDVAEYVGLSPYHFTRAFKRTVGVSPHRYLLLRRLEKAKTLLEKSSLGVAQIAARVGYADSNQLARVFRKELQTSPTSYRRQRGT
jgi:AraC family transcriptional regulator